MQTVILNMTSHLLFSNVLKSVCGLTGLYSVRVLYIAFTILAFSILDGEIF